MINEKTACRDYCKTSFERGYKYCIKCGNQVASHHTNPPLCCSREMHMICPNSVIFADFDGRTLKFLGTQVWTPDFELKEDDVLHCPICGRSSQFLNERLEEVIEEAESRQAEDLAS